MGELSTENYRAHIDEQLRLCKGADRLKDADIEVWDQRTEKGFCVNNTAMYGMDNKVVYQKVIFFFSLQSKINSLKACTYTNWVLVPTYNAELTLKGNVRYRKRCGTEITETQSLGTTDTQLDGRPYRSSGSLSHYNFTVTFGIGHIGAPALTASRDY